MKTPTDDEINETFIIYANEQGGVPSDELGTCLRALGWNPTEVEVQVRLWPCRAKSSTERLLVQALVNFADRDGNGIISLARFKEAIAKQVQLPIVSFQ